MQKQKHLLTIKNKTITKRGCQSPHLKTNKMKIKFTKEELKFTWNTLNENCNPVFDKGTKKQKLTKSVMTKLQNIYNK